MYRANPNRHAMGPVSCLQAARGMSMIELLMALVILLVGITGYVTSVNYSLKSSRQALFGSQASGYAFNAMEIIRAYPDLVNSNTFNVNDGVDANTNCGLETCDESQMMAYHLYRLSCGLNPKYDNGDVPCGRSVAGINEETLLNLPNANMTIARPNIATPADPPAPAIYEFVITVEWDDVIGQWDAVTNSWVAVNEDAAATRQSFVLKSFVEGRPL